MCDLVTILVPWILLMGTVPLYETGRRQTRPPSHCMWSIHNWCQGWDSLLQTHRNMVWFYKHGTWEDVQLKWLLLFVSTKWGRKLLSLLLLITVKLSVTHSNPLNKRPKAFL